MKSLSHIILSVIIFIVALIAVCKLGDIIDMIMHSNILDYVMYIFAGSMIILFMTSIIGCIIKETYLKLKGS